MVNASIRPISHVPAAARTTYAPSRQGHMSPLPTFDHHKLASRPASGTLNRHCAQTLTGTAFAYSRLMRISRALVLSLLVSSHALTGCMGPSDADDVAIDPAEVADSKADGFATALPDVQCTGTPTLPAPVSWRHRVSNIIGFGTPNHRGFDLIASASDTTQEIAGAASYGLIDKALVDEQVDIYACRAGAWQPLGSAVTDKDGLFKLTLSGSERLPLACATCTSRSPATTAVPYFWRWWHPMAPPLRYPTSMAR